MAKRGTRRASRGRGLIGRAYSPVNHAVSAVRSVGSNAFRRSGKVVNTGLGFVQQTGRTLANHANGAVSNLLGKRKSRRSGRKSRKATRKNRK